MNALFSSKKMEWETPVKLFEELNKVFNFTLDVAASEDNKKCQNYYDKAKDGLKQSWENISGGVWCNPPYGRDIGLWAEKAYSESLKHETTIVLLIPSRTDTKYFHEYIYGKAKLFFIRGRLKFLNEKKEEESSAPFPSMLAIYNWKGEDLCKINQR